MNPQIICLCNAFLLVLLTSYKHSTCVDIGQWTILVQKSCMANLWVIGYKREVSYEVQATNNQECTKSSQGGTKISKGSKIHDITRELTSNGMLPHWRSGTSDNAVQLWWCNDTTRRVHYKQNEYGVLIDKTDYLSMTNSQSKNKHHPR